MRALALLVLAPVALLAQEGGWNQMLGLIPGDSVHVHMLDGHRNNGKFVSTAGSSIVIRQRAGNQTFPKDQIRKISVRKFARGRNIAIGAGIGAAAGLGLFASSGGSDDAGAVITVVMVIFAGAGAGIGAFVPSYVTIYQIPRKK